MKKTIQTLIILFIAIPLAYILIAFKLYPIASYVGSSKDIVLNNVEVLKRDHKVRIGFSVDYTIIHSKDIDKYFVVLFFPQAKNIRNNSQITKGVGALQIVVNADLLDDNDYGTLVNPIPVMNYMQNGKYVYDEKQYEFNVRQYRAFKWWMYFD